jgi:hypothetical protein
MQHYKKMQDLLISPKIYTNIHHNRTKNRKCSETEVVTKVLNKFPNYGYISLDLTVLKKLIQNQTYKASRLLAQRLRSSRTC